MSQRSNVFAVVQPEIIDRGQYIQLSVAVTNDVGASVVAGRIFVEIIDSQGRPAMQLFVAAQNTSEFTKLISTAELKPNTRYTIRVSTNNKLINNSFASFQTSRVSVPSFIPLATVAGLLIPLGVQKHEFKIYRTELDARVCPICRPFEGRIFAKGDPDLIRIGPPDLGGQTHYGCRCHYDLIGVPFNAAKNKSNLIHSIGQAVMIIKKHKRLQEIGRL